MIKIISRPIVNYTDIQLNFVIYVFHVYIFFPKQILDLNKENNKNNLTAEKVDPLPLLLITMGFNSPLPMSTLVKYVREMGIIDH